MCAFFSWRCSGRPLFARQALANGRHIVFARAFWPVFQARRCPFCVTGPVALDRFHLNISVQSSIHIITHTRKCLTLSLVHDPGSDFQRDSGGSGGFHTYWYKLGRMPFLFLFHSAGRSRSPFLIREKKENLRPPKAYRHQEPSNTWRRRAYFSN